MLSTLYLFIYFLSNRYYIYSNKGASIWHERELI
nr:MAG TPA: hypothetical protein [Caudoviricetes sp.]